MRYILMLLLGLVIGAAVTFFSFVGAPRATNLPGAPVENAPVNNTAAPAANQSTARLVFDEPFFNTVLTTIFQDLGEPVFRLASNNQNTNESTPRIINIQATNQPPAQPSGACINSITLAPQGSGVQTSVRFVDGKIVAPLAFNGSYNSAVGCLNFRGAAQANIDLRFDQQAQILNGIINVQAVNLEDVQGLQIAGLSGFLSGPITQFVQNSINQNVNPLRILNSQQLNLALPIQATGGTLRTNVKDIRAEVTDALRLNLTYEFSGAK